MMRALAWFALSVILAGGAVLVLANVLTSTCTVGRVGTAMTETLSGPRRIVRCDAWVSGNPRLLYSTDQPADAEHHVLCQFTIDGVTRTVRDTGVGLWGAQRCQQLANGQTAL